MVISLVYVQVETHKVRSNKLNMEGERQGAMAMGKVGINRQLHEVEEQTVDENDQELSYLTLSAVSINSVTEPSNARLVKFRFHDLPQLTSKSGCLKVDSGVQRLQRTIPRQHSWKWATKS